MKASNQELILLEKIAYLEHKQAFELQLVKEQFEIAIESLHPFTLLKNTLLEIPTSNEIRSRVLGTALAFVTSFLAKKTGLGLLQKPVQKILTSAARFITKKRSL